MTDAELSLYLEFQDFPCNCTCPIFKVINARCNAATSEDVLRYIDTETDDAINGAYMFVTQYCLDHLKSKSLKAHA